MCRWSFCILPHLTPQVATVSLCSTFYTYYVSYINIYHNKFGLLVGSNWYTCLDIKDLVSSCCWWPLFPHPSFLSLVVRSHARIYLFSLSIWFCTSHPWFDAPWVLGKGIDWHSFGVGNCLLEKTPSTHSRAHKVWHSRCNSREDSGRATHG